MPDRPSCNRNPDMFSSVRRQLVVIQSQRSRIIAASAPALDIVIPMSARSINVYAVVAFCVILFQSSSAQQTPLAATPPMGWNSWNRYACDVSDALIRKQADAMVNSGLKAAGYQYVNVDDCW